MHSFFHVVIHSKSNDLAVMALQNWDNVQLVPAWNLCNTGQPLPVRGIGGKKYTIRSSAFCGLTSASVKLPDDEEGS